MQKSKTFLPYSWKWKITPNLKEIILGNIPFSTEPWLLEEELKPFQDTKLCLSPAAIAAALASKLMSLSLGQGT